MPLSEVTAVRRRHARCRWTLSLHDRVPGCVCVVVSRISVGTFRKNAANRVREKQAGRRGTIAFAHRAGRFGVREPTYVIRTDSPVGACIVLATFDEVHAARRHRTPRHVARASVTEHPPWLNENVTRVRLASDDSHGPTQLVKLAAPRVGARGVGTRVFHTAMQHIAVSQRGIGTFRGRATAFEVLTCGRIAFAPLCGTSIRISCPPSLEAEPGGDLSTRRSLTLLSCL